VYSSVIFLKRQCIKIINAEKDFDFKNWLNIFDWYIAYTERIRANETKHAWTFSVDTDSLHGSWTSKSLCLARFHSIYKLGKGPKSARKQGELRYADESQNLLLAKPGGPNERHHAVHLSWADHEQSE